MRWPHVICVKPHDREGRGADIVIQKTIVVGGSEGIHARPATELVRIANAFQSIVRLKVDGRTVDAKSVLSIMTLAIRPGTEVQLEVDGADEEQALAALSKLLEV